MADFVARVVQRLREDPGFSRNRHTLALSSPEGRRALRIHRHLRSLERDVRGGSAARVSRDEGRFRLELRNRLGSRTAFLSAGELRLLCADPAVRAAVGGAVEALGA